MARPVKEHTVTEEQVVILREHVKQNPHVLPRYKAQAILGVAAGITPEQLAKQLGKTTQTVREWLTQWDTVGLACLFTGHAANLNSSKLKTEQWEQVCEVLQASPSDVGVPGQMWDVPKLANWMNTEFDVTYTNRTYQYCLKLGGLSFIYPKKFDVRRDESFIDQRMKQIHVEIEKLEQDPDVVVFSADEVKLQEEAEVRKAWLRAGERTVVKVTRGGAKQSYIGFLRKDTGVCTVQELKWQNTETILPTLHKLLDANPGKKVVVIWDNAPWHRSKELREHLGKGNSLENLHLIWLPPYAPDCNPIEHVWATAKANGANIQDSNFENTKKKFVNYITDRVFKYEL